jgi:hypothetical protein
MAREKGTLVPDDFWPDELRLKWASEKHPRIDIAESVERFLAWATSHRYVNHSRAWQNFIIRAADENRLAPMLKKADAQKDRGELLKQRATACSFRSPNPGETFNDYEKAIIEHEKQRAGMVRGKVLDMFARR